MDKDKTKQSLAQAATLGIEFASAIATGVVIGIFLDKYTEKSPLFLIIFFLLGCAAGCLNVLKFIKRYKR